MPEKKERNIFGKFQDVVAGPAGQPSNLELLGALIKSGLVTPPMQMGQQVPAISGTTGGEIAGAATRGTLSDIGQLISQPMAIPKTAYGAMGGLLGRGPEMLAEPTAQFGAGFTGQPYTPSAPTVTPPSVSQRPSLLPTAEAAPMPTGAPSVPAAPEQAGGGIDKRGLLSMAIEIGLPLALAGFGGRQGLAMGAGLATGFGKAAETKRESAEKQAEKELKQQQQKIENTLKAIEEARKQREARTKEVTAATKIKEKKFPGVKLTTEEKMRKYFPAVTPQTAGVEQAEKIKGLTAQSQQKAVQWLQENNAPVTEKNIKAVIKKLGF